MDGDGDSGEIDTMAVAMHEMFMSYTRAGFTESQALELVKAQITAVILGNCGGS